MNRYVIDIEVYSEDGFPEPSEANHPINLISLYNIDTDEVYTFGEKEWTNTTLENENVKYFHCPEEEDLLQKFIDYFVKLQVDVVTGWNVSYNSKVNVPGFDFPYIVNRIRKVFNDRKKPNELSPIGVVNTRENDGNLAVDIQGVTIVDYLSAYKWYSRERPEKYSLDYISNLELKEGKLDYSDYGSLQNLYHDNWNLYVDYNIIDVKRIKQLEMKLGYLSLIQTLSLITKCPMKYYLSMVALLEGRMLVHFRHNNLCAPKMKEFSKSNYPAAYVKEPLKGLHKWLFSIDIASSYPTAIVTLNMSLETYIGRIITYSEDEVIHYMEKREFPEFRMTNFNTGNITEFNGKKLDHFNLMLKKGLVCMSPNGVCFKTKPEGVIAHVERAMFMKRKDFKRKMFNAEDKNEILRFDTTQNSLKTLINSFYGILAFPYNNRYVNVDIASAITSCARHTLKQGIKFSNEMLNNSEEFDNVKSIVEELRSL